MGIIRAVQGYSPAGSRPPADSPISVLVGARAPLLRRGIVHALLDDQRLSVVAQPGNEEAAVRGIQQLGPHVALLEVDGLRQDGNDLMRRLSRTRAGTRVVFLSSTWNPRAIHKTLASGVRGYVGRHATEAELRSTVVAVANGQTVVAEPLRRALLHELARLETPGIDSLSERETQTLQLVADGYAAGLVAKELLVSEATVRTYLRRAYVKLAVTTQAAAVAVAIRHRFID